MTNPVPDNNNNKILDFHGLTVRPYGSYKGVKDLQPVRVMLHPDAVWSLKQMSFEAHCSLGELCRAIIMQWVSEHNDSNSDNAK